MALTLAKIARNIAVVVLHYSGEDIVIEYYPSRITGKMLVEMQALAEVEQSKASAGFTSLIETLLLLIKSWTIFEDEDETVMYPLTPESLAALPISLISQTFQAVVGDARPNSETPQQNGKLPH